MTVKVLRIKRRPEVTKRAECRTCGAELEYAPSDVRTKEVTCCGKLESMDYIECGNCLMHVEV